MKSGNNDLSRGFLNCISQPALTGVVVFSRTT
jgi:hypothetical protein